MTPAEIFRHLDESDPLADEAWRELNALVRIVAAQTIKGSDDDRDEAAQELLVKLVLLRDRGALPVPAHPERYLARALRNKSVDRVRASNRMESMDSGRLADEIAMTSGTLAPVSLPETLGSNPTEPFRELDRLFEHALTLETADPSVREAGWRQIKLLALEPIDPRAALERTGRLAPDASPGDVERAIGTMYKTHQRVRESLLAAVDHLQARGELDLARADELREQIARLKRRQKRANPTSSAGGARR